MAKKPLPLVLSVKALNWRQNDEHAESADAEFKHVRRVALERDKNTCQFCGFKAPSWQEVHHLNDDHADNRPENLVTTCMFCHMCQHIGRAGTVGEAVLIWLPEISQADLHHIVRTCLVAQRWADPYITGVRAAAPNMVQVARGIADGADAVMARLRSRESDAERLIGTSSAAVLGDVLHMFARDSAEAYGDRERYLHGIRLMPTGIRMSEGGDAMPRIVDSWLASGGPFAQMSPTMWTGLYSTYR